MSNIPDFKSKQCLLLTGAGFSHNFGGFLARDMWSEIFNNKFLDGQPDLKNLLRNDDDFESVYSNVLSNSVYSDEQKDIIKKVIEGAYENLDNILRSWTFNSSNPIGFNTYKLTELLNLLVGNSSEKGFFFTLNQDLLMEREKNYSALGIPPFKNSNHLKGREFKEADFITVPGDVDKALQDLEDQNFIYVKLHGSYGWRSSDGSNQMVIGKNKTEIIEKEPILKLYFELFQRVLFEGNKNLLIIGYGFHDQHINQVLLEAVQNHGLKIFVISPTPFSEWKYRMENGQNYALPILNAVERYFPYTFRQIFPPDQSLTTYYKQISEALISRV